MHIFDLTARLTTVGASRIFPRRSSQLPGAQGQQISYKFKFKKFRIILSIVLEYSEWNNIFHISDFYYCILYLLFFHIDSFHKSNVGADALFYPLLAPMTTTNCIYTQSFSSESSNKSANGYREASSFTICQSNIVQGPRYCIVAGWLKYRNLRMLKPQTCDRGIYYRLTSP
jgi:hypothetical protein